MKVLVIGATGTIGKPVADALEKNGHAVVRASRKSTVSVDIQDTASIRAVFDKVKDVDAVVCCAGGAGWGPLSNLSDEDFATSLRYKLMGQVNVVRVARERLKDNGSVTITSGVLASKPMPGSAAVSLVNAGLEGFVRAAALDMPRGIRVNVVSPPWVTESLRQMKMDESMGSPAAVVARAYVASVEGSGSGKVVAA